MHLDQLVVRDGTIYVVNYILDDAPKAQIRGYAFGEEDFLLPG